MQETISLRTFQGQVNNPHQEDIPDNMGVTVSDIDPHLESGVITGIKSEGANYQYGSNSEITDATYSDWLRYESSGSEKWDLVYIDADDNDVSAIADFYAAEASRSFSDVIAAPSGTLKCIKTFNNQVQIGQYSATVANTEPYVVWRLLANKNFFNSNETATAGLLYQNGKCRNEGTGAGGAEITATSGLNSGSTGYFQANILYSWKVSYVYDNLQESNLSGGVTDSDASSCSQADLTVTCQANGSFATTMDRRITGIKVYRAESSDTLSGNLGLHRLIAEIDINSGTDAANWAASGSDYAIVFTDTGLATGATYEEETGIAETLTYSYVCYQINEVGGGYHWTTNVNYVKAESTSIDWHRYIFRSKKFRPNMIDWSNDFVILPEIPIDIKYYNDRLYAFSENKVYRINPELLLIEDVFEGAGVSAKDGVVGTEYGMFFCNKNGAYMLKNNQIITISDPISKPPTSVTGAFANSWEEITDTAYAAAFQRVIARYIPDKRIVLFTGGTLGNVTTAFGFYLPTQEWYHFTLGSQSVAVDSGMFVGRGGEVYLSNASSSFELFASTGDPATHETANYITKEFHLNEPSQNKSWNMIKWDGTTGSGTIQVKYATNGTNVGTSGTTATSDAWINTYAKTMQVWVRTTVDATVDSLDIIVRRLVGKR